MKRLISAAVLLVVALATHTWTRGDVGLGLFGGEYCNGISCETMSWDRMQVARTMTAPSWLLLFTGIAAAFALVLAIGRRGEVAAGVVTAVRGLLVAVGAAAAWFVIAAATSFNRAPPFGIAPLLVAAAIVLGWSGVRTRSV